MKKLLSLVVLLAMAAIPATAQVTTRTFSFSATNFVVVTSPAPAAPQNTVSGSVTITFDPAVSSTGGVDAINLTIDGHTYTAAEVGFSYNAATKNMLIGGTLNGLGTTSVGTNDFSLLFNIADGTKFSLLLYSTSTRTDTSFDASPVTINVSQGSYLVDHYSNNAGPGGAADQQVRLVNFGTNGTPLTSPVGDVCANIYVFDANQEMVGCCSCRITPNGLLTISVANNLTNNPVTSVVPVNGDIKIVPTIAGPSCTPLNYNGGGTDSLVGFGTQLLTSGGTTAATFITETRIPAVPLSLAELAFLPQSCQFARYLGSGKGVCTCGSGS